MAAKYLALALILAPVISEDVLKRKYHEVTFEKYLQDAVALTVDTFNKVGGARDGKIYDVVKLQVTINRLNLSLWTYDRLGLVLRETNCTKENVTDVESCIVAMDPIDCNEPTDRTKPPKKQQYFGSDLAKIQEVKFDKYLLDAINLAVDTFNRIGNVKEGKLYDVVSIKTTVKRDQSCRYQVSTGQINGSQILGCSGVVDTTRK
uniref:Uncharacterized protein n=1 Tax=Lygus hesperus TaxID=30085 RepID=A0A146L9W2_LYGHE